MAARRQSLTIESRTEKLSDVRDFVSDAASRFGFDEEVVNKIALAVDEACTNVIKHGYKYAPDKKITVSVSEGSGKFEIIIEDQGNSFNPLDVKSPDMKKYFSEFRRGGLGMHLMRTLMDEVEYHTFPGPRNEVHLTKFLEPK
jgi:serine/threonine-protein kinase RsbW